MQIQNNQCDHDSTNKCCLSNKIICLVALVLLVVANPIAFAVPIRSGAEARKLFKEAVCQLNDANGNPDGFNNYCNRIVMLTKSDFDLQEQIYADSFSEAEKLIKNKEYSKAEQILSLALRLDRSDYALKILIALKGKLDKFDDIEPMLMRYFDRASKEEKLFWHFNVTKAEMLTYAGNICEKYSNPGQAEHFYRMAIQQTTQPIPAMGLDEWDNTVNKCYYWVRVYAQACLGQLLINVGRENAGVPILSTVKNAIKYDDTAVSEANQKSKPCSDNLFDRIFDLGWQKNREKTYAVLSMSEHKKLFNKDWFTK